VVGLKRLPTSGAIFGGVNVVALLFISRQK
jgi:hypothetical protein